MRFLPIIGLIIVSVSFSHIETQTDWSGGEGVPGPVTEWDSSYDVADQINDTGSSLHLLSSDPLEHTVDNFFDGASLVYATDVDGDGDTDILGAAWGADDITWWENSDTSPGIIWKEHTVDSDFNGAASVYATDIDGDGDTDILGAASGAGDITWWENTDGAGTVWTEHTVDGDFSGAYSVYATDVDGDGDTDILGAAYWADNITWWENADGAVWVEHLVDGNFDGPHSVYATDVDGDGDTDILGAAFKADDITWWENADGAGTVWTEHTVDGSFDGAHSVYATDVDGDGDTDILGAAYEADKITWWENADGAGTVWTDHTVDGSFDGAYSVYATDVDGDGDTDILGTAPLANNITWWENADGPGTVWTEHTVDGDFNGAASVYATDVDGDGDTDILGAASVTHDIAWWELNYFSDAYLESSILDVGTLDTWQSFSSNEDEPAGTSVGFQFRSSNNSSDMGEWSDTVFAVSTNLSGILADSTNFVQYRTILQTTDPSSTPVVNNVTIFYTTYVSIDDTNHDEVPNWDITPAENPSFGSLAIQLSVPLSEKVDLLLYDVTGRLVTQHSQELPTGEHTISFNNLCAGVYFCTVHAGSFTATERIIVLK